MAVKFGVKDKENLESKNDFPPAVEWPYLGKAQLIGVNKEGVGQGEKKYNTLNFHFLLHGDEDREGGKTPKGMHYIHAEFPPREDDEESKQENLITRIAYICKYFMGEENAIKVTTVEGEDLEEAWENLRKKVVSAFKKIKESKDYTKKVIKIKIVGSVYNGKDSLRFPNYIGFISDEKSKDQVMFSKREKAGNKEYIRFQTHAPAADSADNFEGVGKDEALDF